MSELSLREAEDLVAAVGLHAQRAGHRVCVAVVDSAGFMVLQTRFGGAGRLTVAMSEAKAWTAAMLDMPTDALQALVQPGGALYGLAQAAGGRVLPVGGGHPIRRGPLLVGAVGVAGASPDEDAALASAALDATTSDWRP